MSTKITRINQIAIEKPQEVFTSIYHLINYELLKECFDELDGNKATGLDKVTKDMYLMNLDENLNNLFEIKQLINQVIFLENQIDEVGKEIKELYDKLDSHLLSVPGVGINLAPIILSEIGDINNFDKPSKLIAFAGTDPSENQSGNKLSSNDKTSKRGSPYLRHAIYTASLVAISNEPELRAYYDKKISEGKHHFVALAGISRKLLTIIYYILKENRD